MQRIPLKLAKAGMKLAKPVEKDNGMVLMAEGTELTDSLLSRLDGMDIESVVVKGNPVDLDGASGEATSYDKRIERMDHLFRKHQADPYMMKLKQGLKQYFKLKAAAEAAAAKAEAEADQALDEGAQDSAAEKEA